MDRVRFENMSHRWNIEFRCNHQRLEGRRTMQHRSTDEDGGIYGLNFRSIDQ